MVEESKIFTKLKLIVHAESAPDRQHTRTHYTPLRMGASRRRASCCIRTANTASLPRHQ